MNLNHEVTEFITDFLYHQHDEKAVETLIKQFRAGYCYHFAFLLRDTFHRGVVCWAAPFGHIVWQDIDGKRYDIEGEYSGEAFYFIPVILLGEYVRDFLHIRTDQHPPAKKQTLINIIKEYCKNTGIEYNENVENYFRR